MVTNNFRITRLLPTINYAFEHQAFIVIIMAHLGKPYGQIEPDYSLAPVAAELQTLLPEHHVLFLNDCIGQKVQEACLQASQGDIIVLENLRFHPEEEGYLPQDTQGDRRKCNKKDVSSFRTSLSRLADIYVNDSFGSSYKPHSSVTGIHVHEKVAGLQMQQELEYFAQVVKCPARPFLAIFGGAKNKTHVMMAMMDKIDTLIVCGELALECKDKEEVVNKAKECNVKLVFPTDYVTGSKVTELPEKIGYSASLEDVPQDMIVMDCGHDSSVLFRDEIVNSKTIYWNGAPGYYELDPYFSKGSKAMLDAVVEATENGATSILAGRGKLHKKGKFAKILILFIIETIGIATKWKCTEKVSHISTSGGAFLRLLEGKDIPGVSHLTPSKSK